MCCSASSQCRAQLEGTDGISCRALITHIRHDRNPVSKQVRLVHEVCRQDHDATLASILREHSEDTLIMQFIEGIAHAAITIS
jgi:hypothetical protein